MSACTPWGLERRLLIPVELHSREVQARYWVDLSSVLSQYPKHRFSKNRTRISMVKHTILGTWLPSSSISQAPSHVTSKSSLIPSFVVLWTSTFENLNGTCPRSSFTKWILDRGPGSVEAKIGSTTSFAICAAATVMFGHNCSTRSLRNPGGFSCEPYMRGDVYEIKRTYQQTQRRQMQSRFQQGSTCCSLC